MSELGNISQSYGKEVKISVANTYSSTVLNSEQLPQQTIIVSSPINNQSATDLGTYCVLITDLHSNPVRLTYTLQPGNGLNVDTVNSDIVRLEIDNNTLTIGDDGELKSNIVSIVDGSSIVIDNNILHVNAGGITHADSEQTGVVSIDDSSLKVSTNSNLYVDTEHLDKANEYSLGVVTSDANTINIDSNGTVSVKTENLSKASTTNYGVTKIDNNTITSHEGKTYVVTENLQRCGYLQYGVVKPDNNVIKVSDGTLYIETSNIDEASSTTYGTIKVDGVSLISDNGIVSVSQYDKIIENLEQYTNKLTYIEQAINKLNEKISQIG